MTDKPLTLQDFVTQVCQPPVPVTTHVPAKLPVGLSRRISRFPPLVAEATLASNDAAPEPKSRELNLRDR